MNDIARVYWLLAISMGLATLVYLNWSSVLVLMARLSRDPHSHTKIFGLVVCLACASYLPFSSPADYTIVFVIGWLLMWLFGGLLMVGVLRWPMKN